MSEENKTQESTSINVNAGNNEQPVDKIAQLDIKLKRLEDTEKRLDLKTERWEKLIADQMLSGRAPISSMPAPKIETAKEYADRIMSGKK